MNETAVLWGETYICTTETFQLPIMQPYEETYTAHKLSGST